MLLSEHHEQGTKLVPKNHGTHWASGQTTGPQAGHFGARLENAVAMGSVIILSGNGVQALFSSSVAFRGAISEPSD